jgi:hypothetical protein
VLCSSVFLEHAIGRKWTTRSVVATLIVLPLIVLWPFRFAPAVADDRWFTTGTLAEHFFDPFVEPWRHGIGASPGYRPFVTLSYIVTQSLAGADPVPYHLTNFLLHGLNAALLALLVARLSGCRIAAWTTGLLFALHPIQHENVIWISGRTFPMAAAFSLGLLLWTATSASRSPLRQHALGLPLLAGALGSYEGAVTVPLAVLLVRYAVASDDERGRPALLRFFAPYATLFGAYAAFRWGYLSSFGADLETAISNQDPWWRRVSVNSALLGLRLLLAHPMPARPMDLAAVVITGSLALLCLACLAGARQMPRLRRLAIGAIMLGAVSYLPFFSYLSYTDRFAYLTAAAFAAMLGLGCACAWRAGGARRIAIVLVAACALASWIQQLHARGAEWMKSGLIAESLLEQLRRLEPAPPDGARFHFFGVPNYYGRAVLFLTYFPYSVHTAYAPRRIHVMTHDDPVVTPAIVRKIASLDRASHPEDDALRLFNWDPSTERLTRLASDAPAVVSSREGANSDSWERSQ